MFPDRQRQYDAWALFEMISHFEQFKEAEAEVDNSYFEVGDVVLKKRMMPNLRLGKGFSLKWLPKLYRINRVERNTCEIVPMGTPDWNGSGAEWIGRERLAKFGGDDSLVIPEGSHEISEFIEELSRTDYDGMEEDEYGAVSCIRDDKVDSGEVFLLVEWENMPENEWIAEQKLLEDVPSFGMYSSSSPTEQLRARQSLSKVANSMPLFFS